MIGILGLSPSVDKIVSVENLRWGEHIGVKKIREVASGKAINVARVIKKLGGGVVIIGVAGGANGEWIKDELKKEKLRFDFVHVKRNVRQNLTIMDKLRGREIHLKEESSTIDMKELELIRKRMRKWGSKLSFFIISGRLPKGVPVDFYRETISFFKKKKVPILLDSNGPGFVRALSAVPDYIKPNLKELEELAGRRLQGRGEEIRFVKSLIKRGVNMAVVTHGPGDVLVMTSRWGLSLTPPKVRVRNTVGSGDAVAGAIAYGAVKGLRIHDMFKLSVACGTANTLSIGAGFLDIRKVNALTKKVNVKVLYNHGRNEK